MAHEDLNRQQHVERSSERSFGVLFAVLIVVACWPLFNAEVPRWWAFLAAAPATLGDPRSPIMQKMLNLKIKYRESFRPFAPSVLRERVSDWFEIDYDSPYMLLVADVLKSRRRKMTEKEKQLIGIDKLNVPRSEIPAVTHVDYSARVQTVHEDTKPRYHALLSAFERKTGSSVLVNTSFNVRGEPIVCTPEDAFRCFMGNELDVLAVGNCYLRKQFQDPALRRHCETAFEPD